MSRRSVFVAVGIVVLLLGTVGGVLLALLRYEPGHYRRAGNIDPDRRCRLSHEFLAEFSEFWSGYQSERSWKGEFTDEQINSYLTETFFQSGLAAKMLPEGVSEPRLTFDTDLIRIAFQYDLGLTRTVVSISLRVWLPPGEGNSIAVQLLGFQAGLLPCSASWLLEHISEAARQSGIEVGWYRHEGYPVAILRFQADQARPTIQFKAMHIEPGHISVMGRSEESRSALDVLPDTRRIVCLD